MVVVGSKGSIAELIDGSDPLVPIGGRLKLGEPGGSAGREAQATSWRVYHTEKSSTSLCSLRSNQRSHATTGSDSLQQPFRLLMALHTVELPVASAMSTLEKISPVYRKLVSLAVLTDGRGMEVSTKGVHSTL